MTELAELRRIAQGAEAEIFAWGEGQVLRLLRPSSRPESNVLQVAAMRAAVAAGFRVPVPGEVVEIDGRPGLVMERIEGRDLLAGASARPWRLVASGRLLAQVQLALNATPAPAELHAAHDGALALLHRSPLIPPELVAPTEALIESLPRGDRLIHGDFHPGNVMITPDGPVTIDWVNASRGDPAADFARTLLLLRVAALPPGTSRLQALVIGLARRAFAHAYASTYLACSPLKIDRLDDWMLAAATLRLGDAGHGERETLLRIIARRGRL